MVRSPATKKIPPPTPEGHEGRLFPPEQHSFTVLERGTANGKWFKLTFGVESFAGRSNLGRLAGNSERHRNREIHGVIPAGLDTSRIAAGGETKSLPLERRTPPRHIADRCAIKNSFPIAFEKLASALLSGANPPEKELFLRRSSFFRKIHELTPYCAPPISLISTSSPPTSTDGSENQGLRGAWFSVSFSD
jgi:hypothetical protein